MSTQKLPMDVYAGIFLTLLGIVFYYLALELSPEAAVFPKLVLAVFILLAAAMAVQGYRAFKKTGEAKNPLAFAGIKIPLLIFAFSTLYVVAMDFLGFCLATAAFVPGVALFYNNRKPLHIFIATAGLIAFIYLLFVVQLKLILP